MRRRTKRACRRGGCGSAGREPAARGGGDRPRRKAGPGASRANRRRRAGATPAPAPGTPRAPADAAVCRGLLGKRRPPPPAPARRRRRAAATPAGDAGDHGTPPGGSTGVTGANQLIGDKDFNTCKKFPAGKRIVKLNLKPDTELGDLIAWISSITCKQFLLPGTIPANSKKVTVVAPELITPEEAYRLFLGALESVGPDRRALGQVRAHRRDRPRSRPWAASRSTARTPTSRAARAT